MQVEKVCKVCGKNFLVPKARELTAKVCSIECRGLANAEAYKAIRVQASCLHCGVGFDLPKSVAAKGGKFCSINCKNAWMTGRPGFKRSQPLSVTDGPDGYKRIRVPDHPRAGPKGTLFEHRYVIEQMMIRERPDHHFLEVVDGSLCLKKEIHVHHENEDKADNRPENLIACTSAGHKDLHRGIPPMRGEVWPEPTITREPEPRRIECTCERCGTAFSVKRSTWLIRGAKYCSNKCASGYAGDLPSKVERTCLQCGIFFLAKREKVEKGLAKFCSNQCRYQSRVGRNPSEVIDGRPGT
jgi:hypothetical protein